MASSYSLGEYFESFIKAQLASGRYNNASEVLRDALRLMEKMDQRNAEHAQQLRQDWQKGTDSGDAGVLDFAELRIAAQRELAASGK